VATGPIQDPDTTHDRPTALSKGDVVADRYRIDAVLGEGGMGMVYRAEHLHLHKRYALKVLLPQWTTVPEVLARFEREAIAASSIQSPHVAAATDCGRMSNGSFFLVMEYVDGRTLRTVLEAGSLAPPRALHIARGVVTALQAAHAVGVVHRDMKPENVMLVDRDGDPDHVKVLDFGIARVDGPSAAKVLTQVGAVMGTPDYMSPEQAFGQPVDARSDLYSVGVILFEMLTGTRPFSGGPVTVLRQHVLAEVPALPSALLATVDPRLDEILRRLLAKKPEDRVASAGELLAALDECTQRIAVPTPSPRGVDSVAVAPQTPGLRPSVESVGPMTTPARLAVTTLVFAFVPTMIALLFTLGRSHPSSAALGPAAAWSEAAGSTPSAVPDAAPSSTPPQPSAPPSAGRGRIRPGKPPAPQNRRRTGPGGIYIPPPSQWGN
jgi:serine/threonine-protein kinase